MTESEFIEIINDELANEVTRIKILGMKFRNKTMTKIDWHNLRQMKRLWMRKIGMGKR